MICFVCSKLVYLHPFYFLIYYYVLCFYFIILRAYFLFFIYSFPCTTPLLVQFPIPPLLLYCVCLGDSLFLFLLTITYDVFFASFFFLLFFLPSLSFASLVVSYTLCILLFSLFIAFFFIIFFPAFNMALT